MYDDIQDSWESVRSIISYVARTQDTLAPVAGPGAWNDMGLSWLLFCFKNLRYAHYWRFWIEH